MDITRRCDYACRILRAAYKSGDAYVSVSDIADEEDIPYAFARSIQHDLVKGGLIKTVRGAHGGLALNCLAGPLKGQIYPFNTGGMMLGRDTDCTVRFPSAASGISRHHCALRWQQGVPVLVDLGSAYGTYMGDGRRLPPNYPMSVGPGTRFYLSNPGNLFQITVI